jgi:hypothetical protein
MAVLDRHALVMAIWSPFVFVATILFHYGFASNEPLGILVAFVALLAGFIGHIIVNAATGTIFTSREVALGLVTYAAGLVAFGIAALTTPGIDSEMLLALSLGFLAIFAAATFYLIAHFGGRRAFEAFDVVSDFRAGNEPPPSLREEGPP